MSESLLSAVLDACVIFQATLRDNLLRAAELGLFEIRWSDEILDEAIRNLIKNGTISTTQAQRLLMAMRQAFPEATVKGFESLIPHLTNDEKDRHVLAAAVVARADIIVTSNLKDFPEQALAPFQIEAMSPDQFLIVLFRQYPETMIEIVIQQAAALRNPPKTVAEVLDELALSAPQFVVLVRSWFNTYQR